MNIREKLRNVYGILPGLTHDDSDDLGIGSSVTSSVAQGKLDFDLRAFSLHEPGITSTPNKPSVDKFIKRYDIFFDELYFYVGKILQQFRNVFHFWNAKTEQKLVENKDELKVNEIESFQN